MPFHELSNDDLITSATARLSVPRSLRRAWTSTPLTFKPVDVNYVYTLFQNGHHFSVHLFTCKSALVSSFINTKFIKIEVLDGSHVAWEEQ